MGLAPGNARVRPVESRHWCGAFRPSPFPGPADQYPMTRPLTVDEDLLHRLPLPLAQLYRRAHNAKTALERHLTAYYLWEAALKLLGSVAIVEYTARGANDPQLAERLQNLARPSLGH